MQEQRLATANAACQFFIPETRLELRKGRVWVCWTNWRGEAVAKQWQTRGSDFYPVWHNQWGHGGTCCSALSQLVRFVRGLPVLPLAQWEYWCSPTVALSRCRGGEDQKDALLTCLKEGGYPVHATCIFCGKSPIGRYDWYNRDGKSGPGCWHQCPEKEQP